MGAESSQHHWFVAPPLDGPITGGTLYNRFLAEALQALGDRVSVVSTVEACEGFPWVDSLFLPQMQGSWGAVPAGLLVHYLPSVFEGLDTLETFESEAFRGAATLMCTGAWMRDAVVRLGAEVERTALVEPGVHEVALVESVHAEPVVAVVVGTVTERKGMLPLLEALRRRAPRVPWRLEILGDLDADPAYADACRRAAQGLPVRFRGALPPEQAREAVAASHVLLSAASIESYGMAIAEAQAHGVPVLARRGGHVQQLVERVSSGVVVDDVAALADAFGEMVDNPAALAERRRFSQANRPRRSWLDAAREFRALSLSSS